MIIDETICTEILLKLRELYPHMLMADSYVSLNEKYGEDTLDGHLIYLYETGQIILPSLEYTYDNPENPVRGSGRWFMDVYQTRITSLGMNTLTSAGL